MITRRHVNTRSARARRLMPEGELYEIFADFPRPSYPFPDITPEYLERLRQDYYRWVEEDCHFNKPEDRQRHKDHRFTDIPARGLPYLTYQEQIPICRYSGFGAILDDYLDHASGNETRAIRTKILDCMLGRYVPKPGDIGIFRQFRLMYADAQRAEIPARHYEKFVAAIDQLFTGFQDEKKWKADDTPPPLPVYTTLRAVTSGAIPYCKYVPVQRDYRDLPDEVLEHPHILRLHWLTGALVGFHNDFTSAPRELSRRGDVINIVAVLAQERGVSLEDAWMMGLEMHDQALHEFIVLQENLPDFGKWQEKVERYAGDLGTNIQGIYSWHHRDTLRYVPGAYVEPTHVSAERNEG